MLLYCSANQWQLPVATIGVIQSNRRRDEAEGHVFSLVMLDQHTTNLEQVIY